MPRRGWSDAGVCCLCLAGGVVMSQQQFQSEVMDEYQRLMETGEMSDEQEEAYAEYLMNKPELNICNGDRLIEVMERGAYFEQFVEYKYGQS